MTGADDRQAIPGASAVETIGWRDASATALIILLGLQAMVVQIVLIRESLVIFQGNELCFGVVFAAWLVGIAGGAAASAKFSSRIRGGAAAAQILILTMALLPLAQVYVIRQERLWLDIPPGELAPFTSLLLCSLVTITPFSLLVGAIFPFAFQLFRRWAADAGGAIGRLYVIEAAGSVLGGVLFTFHIAGKLDAFSTLTITGLTSCVLVLVHVGDSGNDPAAEPLLVASAYLAFLLGACLLGGVARQKHYDTVLLRWNSFNPDLEYVSSVESRYENLVVARRGKQFSLYGNGQHMFSFPDEPTYAEQASRVLTEHPSPKKILLIGGGAGGLVRQMLMHSPARLDYVELDPALIALVLRFLPEEEKQALEDPRVRVKNEDGRFFVKHTQEKYDLVFVNMPDPSTAMINRFFTREFFKEVKAILAPRGVLATRISSAVGYLGEEVGAYAASLNQTLRSVFAEVIASPGDVNYFFACDARGVVTFDLPTLMRRYKERKVNARYFNEYMFATLLQPEQVENLARQLAARQNVPLNSDFRPVTYFFNLMLWDQFAGRQLSRFYRWISRVQGKWVALVIVILFLARVGYILLTPRRAQAHQRFNILAIILAAGLAGLSSELILLFMFQNIYGYVYERVGLIIAAFMVGLAIGGAWSNRIKITSRHELLLRLCLFTLLIAVYSCLLPAGLWLLATSRWDAVWGEASSTCILALTAAAGFLTGAPFPVASKLYLDLTGKAGRAAGLVDSMDHLGAFIGALVTGVLLIPLLGVVQTALTVALLNIASLGLVLLETESMKVNR